MIEEADMARALPMAVLCFWLSTGLVLSQGLVAAMFGGGWYFGTDGFAGVPWASVQERIVVYAMLSTPVALFMTTAFGAPYVHRLAELGRATALRTAIAGAVAGAMPFLLFDGYVVGMNLLLLASEPYTRDSLMEVARWAGMGAWCGSWSAAGVLGGGDHPAAVTEPGGR